MRACGGPEKGADGNISSCTAGGVEAKSFQRRYYCGICLIPVNICCSSPVHGFRSSLPARSGSVVWIFTELLVWCSRLRPAQLPGSCVQEHSASVLAIQQVA